MMALRQIALLWALCLLGLSRAAQEPEPLKFKAGDRAALLSHVSSLCEDYDVVWDVNRETLVWFEEGGDPWEPSDRYKGRLSLDRTTGSLFISDLRPADSGLYTGQITCRNNPVHKVQYNVNVEEEAPEKDPDSPPAPDSAAGHYWIAGVFVFLGVSLCIGLMFKVKKLQRWEAVKS